MTTSIFATDGLWTIFLPSVHVEIDTLWTTPKYANCLVSSTCWMMVQPTSWNHAWRKFATIGVEIEPRLQPLTGKFFPTSVINTSPDARGDIGVGGFWTKGCNTIFDTWGRVFYPSCKSYKSRSLKFIFQQMESDKKKQYGGRIREVEHGSFTPLAFSSSPLSTTKARRL